MAEISFGPRGGVKFSDIIDKLVEVARAPIKTLEAKKANYQDKITLLPGPEHQAPGVPDARERDEHAFRSSPSGPPRRATRPG